MLLILTVIDGRTSKVDTVLSKTLKKDVRGANIFAI